MSVVIGLDQGGSGTRAVICELDGRLLGTGSGPGACHPFDGMDKAMAATRLAVNGALAAAGMAGGTADIFVGGYTGADWPDEYDLLQGAVQQQGLASAVHIVNDSIAAMRGGTEQPYGAILVAGTGANCAVRAPDGREYIYHYYHDAELQGGSALGTATLKAIYRAETGRPPQTTLKQRVLAFFELLDVDSLMRAFVEGVIPESRVAEIAPLLFAEARAGDRAAREIVVHFAEGCTELLVNGLQRLEMSELDVEVVLSGGVFKADSPLLLDTLYARLHQAIPRARPVHARYEPVVGAALLALEKRGITIAGSIATNLAASAAELGLIRIAD